MNNYFYNEIFYLLAGGNRILESAIYKNFMALIKDITGVATIILGVLAGLILVAFAIKRVFSSGDDRELHSGASTLIKIAVWLIIGASASGIVNLVLDYFNK